MGVSRGLENDTNFKSYTQNTIAPVASSLLRLLFLYFLQKLLLLPPCYYHLHSHYSKTLFSSSSYRHYSICFSSCSTSPRYSNFFIQSTAFSLLLFPRFLQLASLFPASKIYLKLLSLAKSGEKYL